VLAMLLFSPYRGLFFTSPVLLVSIAALAAMWLARRERPLVALVAGVTAFLLLVNASFNGWDGGWTAVPRYLGPAMALLAVPLAVAFDRWRALASGLFAVSLLVQLLLVTVDPQVPIGDIAMSGRSIRAVVAVDPITRYVLPLFLEGHAWPLLDESIDEAAARSAKVAAARGESPAEIDRKAAGLRRDLRARIEGGGAAPFPLAGVTGPVSANPIGIYEGDYYQLFPAGSPQADGNSFNLGEWIFPKSRLSLLPFLLVIGALVALFFQSDDEAGASTPAHASTAAPPGRAAAGAGTPDATRGSRKRKR